MRSAAGTARNLLSLPNHSPFPAALFFTPIPNFAINETERTLLPEYSSSAKIAKQATSFPAAAYAQQDTVFLWPFAVLTKAIADHTFPAASVAVTHREKLVALKSFGRFTYEPDSPEVTNASIFDLASVTKVVATTTAAMILYQRGLLDLETPVVAILPEFDGDDRRRREITLRMLLSHSSGLPAHEKFFLRVKTRDELLTAAFTVPLAAEPASVAVYSDVGFIVLGVALERLADEPLDRFCQREIFGPLGMAHTAYNPSPARRSSIPPTADDRTFRGRIIQGEVYDENASVLGGVAPHAGLFAPASDVAIFAHAMLHGGNPILRPETLALFTRRETAPSGTFARPRMGHAFVTFTIRKALLRHFLRPSGIHRNLPVDRPRAPAFDHPANQPHLARQRKSSHQTSAPTLPRRDRRSVGIPTEGARELKNSGESLKPCHPERSFSCANAQEKRSRRIPISGTTPVPTEGTLRTGPNR